MTSATLSIRSSDQTTTDGEVLVLAAHAPTEGSGLVVLGAADAVVSAVAASLEAIGFGGKKDEFVRLPAPAGLTAASIAVVGLGTASPDVDALRYAAGVAGRRTTAKDAVVISFGLESSEQLVAVAEGAGLGSYDFTDYRGIGAEPADGSPAEAAEPVGEEAGSATSSPRARSISIVSALDSQAAAAALERALASVDAVALVRDLVNIPALDLYPSVYADRVQELAAGLPLDVTVWNEQELVAEGFGGIAGVGQGSTRPPRLVKVAYSPAGAAKHLAFVGKGITFDTGGLSLKPPVSMIGMKYDMAGSATVLAAVLAAARLELPVRITAWLCLAENMPSGTAIRPGDVLTIKGGRTVEVLNTDAEGRLVLADGLVAASAEQPDAIVDVATLTGAAVVALGNRYVAAMGDEALVADVLGAAKKAGESIWPMPLPAELRPLLASDIADIANVKPGNTAAGMLVAGVFLQEFVGKREDGKTIPWAHLDIAGPAQNKDGGYGYTVKGPTGVTVRTLLGLAESFSRG
ncbi:leucyl aminopeptidase [Herbiconiux sp. CPCC 203407]|uniref:Probable cytosol aminopeptidase n=1 Tax=Herbiconiux oxytropis TaxID=2970915 RepID=A0AA41XGZ7_9MICO|nr:leucyl aminopeptidase [Herbiconiux oxytropis]MCS5720486.1 leucyl aminopeptidase [Herbiconiux oxytropis]MCS5726059.1 leucyl aminopeptidase [Herbiconiux oxytropis]